MRAEELKFDVSIEDYLSKLNVELKKVGNDTLTSVCPICSHNDCFRITSSKQLYKCFSCDNGGDIIHLCMKIDNCDFREAMNNLCNMFGLENNYKHNDKANKKKHRERAEILEVACIYYEKIALNSKPFLRFVEQRKFSNVYKKFRLGYANGNLHTHLRKQGFSDKEMLRSGLVKKNKDRSLYDFFNYQIIFPYLNSDNKVVHLKGKMVNKDRNSIRVYQLPLKNKNIFFGQQNVPKEDEFLYLVEGESDAIALSKINKIAWAIGGQISEEQLKILLDILKQGQNIVLTFDNDDAGEKYLIKCKKELESYCLPDVLKNQIKTGGKLLRGVFPEKYKDIDEALRENTECLEEIRLYPELKRCIQLYSQYVAQYDDVKYSPDLIGRLIFEYFNVKGSFFVVNDKCNLLYKGKQYRVDNNLPFKSLIYQESGINYAINTTKIIWESLQVNCYHTAQHTKNASWIHTDFQENKIYYNLCNKRNELICIEPDKITIVKNGSNKDNIFLLASPKTQPIEFVETDIKEGLKIFFDLFMNNLSCSEEWSFYIITLLIKTFLINYTKAHGINKFTGHQGAGKTDAAGMMTALLYGQNFVTVSSTASDYTDASSNPLTLCDNLEIKDLNNNKKEFLLGVATGITRQKRKIGTDDQNVYEKALTQVIVTSIESFELSELIERTISINFDEKFFCENFSGSIEIENQIIQNRNKILSAIFLLISKVLFNFSEKKAEYLNYLSQIHSNHSKKRLNEHFSCLSLIADEFIKQLPDTNLNAKNLLDFWIKEQDQLDKKTYQETSVIVQYLNILINIYKTNKDLSFYNITPLRNVEGFQFISTTSNLLTSFNLLAKQYNFSHKFSTSQHLANRMNNEHEIMKRAGWTKEKHKTIRGIGHFLFKYET